MNIEITICGLDRFRVRSSYSPVLVDRFKMVPGRHYDSETKTWDFPLVRDCLLMVCDVCGMLPSMLPTQELRVVADYRPVIRAEADLSLIQGHEWRTPPYQHQRAELALLVAHNRWLCAAEQGTGKSLVVANRLRRFLDERGHFQPGWKCLILCPKSVCCGWKEQLMQHAGLMSVVIEGNSEQRRGLLRDAWAPKIKIANYDLLLHTDEFRETTWPVVVLDEVQYVRNFTAARSKLTRKLTAQAQHVWALSGTPAPNGLEDWLGVLSAVDPNLLPVKTKTAFADRYLLKTRLGDSGPFVVAGYRNVPELHALVQKVTSRVTKAEALDLPEKVYSTRRVKLEGEQARVYRELRRDAVARLKDARREGTLTLQNVLTESLRLLQIAGGFVPDDSGHIYSFDENAKRLAVSEVLEEYPGQQIVFWCNFRQEVSWLADYLVTQNHGLAMSMTGASSSSERQEALDWFSRGDARFFVATAGSGGVGVNGLQCANVQVYYSRGWKLDHYLQSQDRLHRIGQKNSVSVIKLIADGTVDEKVDAALDRKASLQEMLLNADVEEML